MIYFSDTMKYTLNCIFLISIIIASNACKVYSPLSAPIAGVTDKNEIFISSGLSLPGGVSISTAYSPVEHLSLMAYGTLGPENSMQISGQAGYYWNKAAGTTYEICGVFSQGRGKMIRTDHPGFLTGNYRSALGQFNFTQKTHQKNPLEYGFGVRTGVTWMDISDNGFYESDGLDPVSYINRYLLLEPIAFFRFGKKKIKTGLQLSGTSLINLFENQRQIPYHAVSLSISMNYKFKIR